MPRLSKRSGLAPIASDDDFAQMVPLPVAARDPEALRGTLFERHRTEVPVTTHAGRTFVRVSVAGYLSEAELHALEEALRSVPA